ncbi:SipW-dependent-type signal peptide-containing protein [Cytobacillus pseudoceanisediminis]|uniref:SipW-dependent-type signal peptide-containing protein n=1 Tax=Cytobacillus pseudoceanisediminis TaxID=3051614 RepID=UPI003C30B3AD
MSYYLSRKYKSRKLRFKKNKKLRLVANLWISYLLLLSFSYIVSGTYSAYNDQEEIKNTITASANYCDDDEYSKNNQERCKELDKLKCKDNSGRGNGSEPCDEVPSDSEDCDNPAHPVEGCTNNHNNGIGPDKNKDKDKNEDKNKQNDGKGQDKNEKKEEQKSEVTEDSQENIEVPENDSSTEPSAGTNNDPAATVETNGDKESNNQSVEEEAKQVESGTEQVINSNQEKENTEENKEIEKPGN